MPRGLRARNSGGTRGNPSRIMFDDLLFARLTAWVERHYRDRLVPDDLRDARLLDECRAALDAL